LLKFTIAVTQSTIDSGTAGVLLCGVACFPQYQILQREQAQRSHALMLMLVYIVFHCIKQLGPRCITLEDEWVGVLTGVVTHLRAVKRQE
jgi:hypothetical protein